jgi:CCR4-NOT transcription complex subunit 7/8
MFAELLTSSGLVLCEDITWISFSRLVACTAVLRLFVSLPRFSPTFLSPLPHPFSGYDFGYLLKLLTGESLPYNEKDFYELLAIFFPHVYDIKSLMKSVKTLKGGLQEVADTLQVGAG